MQKEDYNSRMFETHAVAKLSCFARCTLGSVLLSDFILDHEIALEALSPDASVVCGLAYLMDIDT